jgi:hypothetical protein
MDKTPHKAANRCLPLVMANQAGWVIRCPVKFKVTWNSHKPGPHALSIEFAEKAEVYKSQIRSSFGSGILSFVMPWLFRTSDGYGLMVRGPTNMFREHAAPLDGFVETDWAPYTFTMNWKMLTHMTSIWFNKGDPICQLFPYPMKLLEMVKPSVASLDSNPVLKEDFREFVKARREQQANKPPPGEGPNFRMDYLRGRRPDGERAPVHKTSLRVQPFAGGSGGTGEKPPNAAERS